MLLFGLFIGLCHGQIVTLTNRDRPSFVVLPPTAGPPVPTWQVMYEVPQSYWTPSTPQSRVPLTPPVVQPTIIRRAQPTNAPTPLAPTASVPTAKSASGGQAPIRQTISSGTQPMSRLGQVPLVTAPPAGQPAPSVSLSTLSTPISNSAAGHSLGRSTSLRRAAISPTRAPLTLFIPVSSTTEASSEDSGEYYYYEVDSSEVSDESSEKSGEKSGENSNEMSAEMSAEMSDRNFEAHSYHSDSGSAEEISSSSSSSSSSSVAASTPPTSSSSEESERSGEDSSSEEGITGTAPVASGGAEVSHVPTSSTSTVAIPSGTTAAGEMAIVSPQFVAPPPRTVILGRGPWRCSSVRCPNGYKCTDLMRSCSTPSCYSYRCTQMVPGLDDIARLHGPLKPLPATPFLPPHV